jgi:hypothetical protein
MEDKSSFRECIAKAGQWSLVVERTSSLGQRRVHISESRSVRPGQMWWSHDMKGPTSHHRARSSHDALDYNLTGRESSWCSRCRRIHYPSLGHPRTVISSISQISS